jgi:hypothetical protein
MYDNMYGKLRKLIGHDDLTIVTTGGHFTGLLTGVGEDLIYFKSSESAYEGRVYFAMAILIDAILAIKQPLKTAQ